MGRKRKKGIFDNVFTSLKNVGEGIGDIAECVADDMSKSFNRKNNKEVLIKKHSKCNNRSKRSW